MNDNSPKPLYQKISTLTDWIIRVIVINIMMIFCSLGIITIYAALLAGFKMFSDYTNKNETKLFKGFFKYFVDELPKKLLLGTVFAGIIVLGYFNSKYYIAELYANPNWFLWTGYIFTLGVILLIALALVYSFPILIVNKEKNFLTLLKQALYLAGKFFPRTLLIIIVWIIPIAMWFDVVSIFIFIFVGLSIPVLLECLLTKKIMLYIEELKNNEKEE